MRTIHVLILAVLLVDAFCFLRKTHSTMTKKKAHVKQADYEQYTQQLLTSINDYRTENSFPPLIEFSPELEATATQEANNLIASQNFGTHDNFGTLRDQVSNEFLTEIILRITYSEELPPADVFCQNVVEAIAQNQNKYLTYAYSEGGAAIQKDEANQQYIIVIHLAKQLDEQTGGEQNDAQGGEQTIPTYASCKDALEQSYTGDQINVVANGELKTITCDQLTQNGGWSRILDSQQDLVEDNILPIDDLELEYTEVLFKTKDGYEFNSRTSDDSQYKFDGFLFQSNALKFGDNWYISEEYDDNFYYDRDSVEKKQMYKAAEKIEILEPSQTCYFEDTNIPSYCAKEFVFKAPLPEGRLSGISDCESLGQYAFENNKWKAYFEIYVR